MDQSMHDELSLLSDTVTVVRVNADRDADEVDLGVVQHEDRVALSLDLTVGH